MILAIDTLPFTPVKPTHSTTFIHFYLSHFTQINEINYLQFISIIGMIGSQSKTQTKLWEQWSTTSLSMDPNYIMTTTTPTTSYSVNLNLVVSVLLSSGAPTSKGVYRLNCHEMPSRRRSADDLPDLQSTNCQY